MEDKVYTVQENINYFERIRGERHNGDIEGFTMEHAESETVFRNLMRERRASGSGRSGTDGAAQPADSYPVMMEKRVRDKQIKVDDDSADADGAHNKAVPGGDESLDEVDKMQHVTNFVNDVHTTGATGGNNSVDEEDNMQHVTNVVNDVHVTGATVGDDEEDNIQHVTNVVNDVHVTGATSGDDSVDREDSMKQVTGIASEEDVDSSDVGEEHISGVTGGDVDNSTVVGVVKGGMRNKQTLIDSDICITGGRSQPDGDDTDADDKPKEVTGVAGGAVQDATVVGEVHGGMENEQTIKNSKIYSDGGFGGSLQFLDLNIRQRDNSGEQQDGAVQIIKDCIIDLRKPDDPIDKDNKGDDADCYKDEAGSVAGNPFKEPDEETENQEMQKKSKEQSSNKTEYNNVNTENITWRIQEVKEQSEREEETLRLIEEKQADMEEQETRRLMQERQAAMEEQETQRLMQEKQAAMEEQETRRLMQERQAAMEEQETRRLMEEKQADMEEQETRRLMQERQAAMEEQETRRLMQEKQADMEEQETQRLVQEKQADMEEQESRRLMQERQAAMEEQLQREQREREQMQFEVQRIGNEQRQNAAYRGQPNQVVVNPHMAAGGMVVVPAAPRLVYVNPNPQPARRGNGLMENIQQFFNGL